MKKIYTHFVVLILLMLLIPFRGSASHIVGGVITYTYNGGNNYSIQLILYRDCSSATQYSSSALVEIRQANGTAFTPSVVSLLPTGPASSITPILPPCATSPSVVPCAEQRIYTGTVTLPPTPGGIHLYYAAYARNGSINNITNPSTTGELFYAHIPCYNSVWSEDFTLPNGTTVDPGPPTAWSETLGITPPTSAQVNNGQFEVIGSNNGSMVWSSQTISISSYTNGVNLSVNASRTGNNFGNNDTLRIMYSLNGGALTNFPTNGSLTGAWTPKLATATGLVGNTIQIFIRAKFNANNNSTGKTMIADMVTVYDNTFIQNSSPTFNSLPPLLLCATNSFSLDNSATDPDGDVLVYSMYTPYDSMQPKYPNNTASMTPVTWVAGYSATSPFNAGGPSVTINAGSGWMTGVANTLGKYVFGVKCSEYRGGVLLSETVRDYEVTTVTCPPSVPSAPTAVASTPQGTNAPLCAGQTLTLTASTVAGATYSWTGPNSFTANVQNPTIPNATTLAAGVYSVYATIAGCTGPAGTVAVTVNTVPTAPTAAGNTPLCVGQTLSLTATGLAGATFSWTGPNAFTSNTQNPTIAGITLAGAGTYSVTRTVGGCVSPVATVAIVVSAIPSAPTASANTPICAGQTLSLTSTFTAGATYNWTGPNSFTSNVQNPTIAGVTLAGSGIYSVTATQGGCTGPVGTISVTVNNAPSAPVIGANTPLCVGQTLSLTASFTAGVTYSWSGPNAFTSNVQNPTIAGITLAGSGIYSVTANNGCSGPTATISVTVNPIPAAPTASANTPLCTGQTLSLTSTFTAGATYNWSGPNSFTSNVQNPTIAGATPAATGLYSVTATIAGCTGPVGTISVNVSNQPAAPTAGANNPLCVGQTLSLTATFTAGLNYTWSGPNSFTSNVQNPTIAGITPAGAGTYSVFATTAGGCAGPVGVITVTVNAAPSAPTAGANTPLCVGQTLNLSATFSAGATYSWAGPNSFTANVQNPSIGAITLAGAGTYSVNMTVGGCPGPNGTVAVVVNPTPASPTVGANSPLCAGQTLSLTANPGGNTYNWTGPNAFSSALQNPTIPAITLAGSGTYSVTQTVLGCTGPAGTVAVTVNPIPASPTAGANSPICALQTLSLTANPGGATYNWTGPNSFTSNIQNPTIASPTVNAAGTYSVTQTLLGCTSPVGTVNVIINATPAAPTAAGTSTLCSGSTVSLTANPGGATYSWTGPNGFTSALQNPTIPGASTLATGMYSVTATIGGCTGPAGTFSVNVYGIPSPPTLGSNSPLCTGQTLSLTANFIAGASYAWTGPNAFSSAVQNPTLANVTLAAAGNYSVNVNVSGCGSAGTVIAISINPTPAAPTAGSNSTLCAGSTLSLTGLPNGANSYSWTGPNTFTSNVQNPTIAGATTLATGIYSLTQTVGGCTSPAGTVSVTINPIPAAPTAASNSTLCAGSTLSLSALPNGSSYNWTGPNAFTSAIQNPTIGAVTVAASGTYSVTQTVLGCTGPAGTVAVTVNPIPSAPAVGANAPICALQTLSLTANPAGATYSWTGPNSFTSNVQNPTIVSASTLASGTYSVTQTLLGCTGPAGTISVTVNPAAPTPTAGSNSPICLNQTLNFTQTPIAGATYSWAGPNSFTSTVQSPSIANAATVATGIYTVFATVAGCPGLTSTLSILVSQPGTVTAPTSTVCANNSTVVLNGSSSTGSGTWTSSGGGSFAPNSLNGNFMPTAAEIAAGVTTLTLTSTNNGGCVPVSITTSVFVTPAPTSSAGSNQTVCANNANVALSGSVTVATGGTWTSSGTGSFSPNNAVLNATYVPSAADIASGNFTITLTTTGNGNCFAVSNTKVITISPAPVVNPGNNPQVVCKNNPNFTLNGSSTTGSGTWASSGTGTFSPNNNILNPTYIPSTADTTAGTITLTLTSTNNGGCNPVSQTMSITYVSTLAVSAGSNQTVCSNNATVSLNGVSTTSAGVWTSSGTGTFSPSANSLTTNYVPSPADIAAGVVTLTLTTANNGGCNPIFSTMNITITPGPVANAGPSQTVCANNATVNLAGSFTVATGGIWSSAGTGTFTPNNTNMNSSYIASPADTTAGSVVITLSTTGNGNCIAATNTMLVSFSPAPLVNAGANFGVCKNNPTVFLNGYSSTSSGTWTSLGSGTFAPNNSVLNPTYTPSTADTTAGSVLLVLTSINNGGCNPVTDTVKVTFSGIPIVSAGANQTVCANNSTVVLTGTSSTGSGTWTSSGSGTFAPNTYTGNYVPSPSDITSGVFTLTLTSTNNGGCNAVTQQMTVNVSPAPQASAGLNQTVCANSSSINLSGSFSISAGAAWSSSGTGSFTPNNTNMNVGYVPSIADTAAGSVQIFLTTTGNGNCLQVKDTLVINFIHSPYVNAGSDLQLCPNSSSPQLNGVSSTNSGTWTTLGSGVFSPNSGTLNPTYVPSAGDNTAGTVTLILISGTTTCGSAADTLLISFKPKPTAGYTYTNLCFGATTSFTDMSTVPTGSVSSWYWHFDADTSTLKNPTYSFGSTGSHTVTLLVSNGVCQDSIKKNLNINKLPSSSFSFTTLCHDSVAYVQTATVSPGNITGWSWRFGDSTTSVLQNPFHTYADTGTYIVTLLVKSDSNCVGSFADTVHVTKCNDARSDVSNPAVPSGFSPNGDGKNDILFVKGGPFNSLDFRIFNEWGNMIFTSNIQSSGWDGTFKSAVQAAGRYIWTVTGETIDGRKVNMSGEVILSR